MSNILIGHRKDTNGDIELQTLEEHCRVVGRLCGETCRAIGLEHLGVLTGYLHDMGKAHSLVQMYLQNPDQWRGEKLNHSAAGMRWVWATYGEHATNKSQRLAAQFAAIAIGCHHGKRCNVISPEGQEDWLEHVYSEKAAPLYEESRDTFLTECISIEEMDVLMEQASEEILNMCRCLKALSSESVNKQEGGNTYVAFEVMLGLVQRYLYGALVDADWRDTANFMDGTPLEMQSGTSWTDLAARVEEYLSALVPRHPIDHLRQEISKQCYTAAQQIEPGIYRLYVPTGGGKTYSGLRFCAQAAARSGAERIIYCAPFRSIIGQNTKEFRKALGNDVYVLEHHSDVVMEEGEFSEELLSQTQRWQGVPFIATTMVQLLNTLFAAPRQNVRRMPALAGSVLLIDEIQSLPVRHTYLFNLALNLLAKYMGCTIVLCTATQPALERVAYPICYSLPMDIVADYRERFDQFRRTQIVPVVPDGGYSAEDIAEFALDKTHENRSILLIFNTRRIVERVYDYMADRIDNNTALFCLTTHLCPQHRIDVLDEIRARLDNIAESQRLICVSTQLIEAGVDVSFDCVIRSMAGLPSVAQAAGRCNRHGDSAVSRPVYLMRCAVGEESLSMLPELEEGRRTTERLLAGVSDDEDLLSPDVIEDYYVRYYGESYSRSQMPAPIAGNNQDLTLIDLMGKNESGIRSYADLHNVSGDDVSNERQWELRQAFEFAEGHFCALDNNTTSVMVPYGRDGIDLISRIQATPFPSAKLLREAQRYSVGIYDNERKELEKDRAIEYIAGGAVLVLQSRQYNMVKGIQIEPQELPFLDY